ncbi:hypothetical protein BCR43DRAFT_509322 [Syncephalastrum racemosum]|uniref:Uncharacterized protein n=1 Tax=Syncephalastrum racemosum TaxID=13706 RepID=A0A1X2GYT8_SYNRA|nr:hypothetical protein BCR43DRAFT_509322 [Syncephalastrum racemosum]
MPHFWYGSAIRMPYNVNLEKRRNYHAEILIPVFAITSRYKLLYAKWPIPESKICKSDTDTNSRIIDVSSDALPGHTRKGSDLGMSGIGTAPLEQWTCHPWSNISNDRGNPCPCEIHVSRPGMYCIQSAEAQGLTVASFRSSWSSSMFVTLDMTTIRKASRYLMPR